MDAEVATSLKVLLIGDEGALRRQLQQPPMAGHVQLSSISDYLTAIASLGHGGAGKG